jgi:hypothetical protein
MGEMRRRRFEHRLGSGPRPERIRGVGEVEFDIKTRRKLKEAFWLIDRAQAEAWAASRGYVISAALLGMAPDGLTTRREGAVARKGHCRTKPRGAEPS